MATAIHEAAPHHLPPFVTGPGQTDVLFVVVVSLLIAIVLAVGNLYFRLHALPERMAHGANSAQLQLVGVLALLALFTHNNIFWVAALLIAALKVPDFSTPLNAIARSLERLSERVERSEWTEAREEAAAPVEAPAEPSSRPSSRASGPAPGTAAPAAPDEPTR